MAVESSRVARLSLAASVGTLALVVGYMGFSGEHDAANSGSEEVPEFATSGELSDRYLRLRIRDQIPAAGVSIEVVDVFSDAPVWVRTHNLEQDLSVSVQDVLRPSIRVISRSDGRLARVESLPDRRDAYVASLIQGQTLAGRIDGASRGSQGWRGTVAFQAGVDRFVESLLPSGEFEFPALRSTVGSLVVWANRFQLGRLDGDEPFVGVTRAATGADVAVTLRRSTKVLVRCQWPTSVSVSRKVRLGAMNRADSGRALLLDGDVDSDIHLFAMWPGRWLVFAVGRERGGGTYRGQLNVDVTEADAEVRLVMNAD